MEVVNSGSEVWYSNGPGLLVIDCAALEIRCGAGASTWRPRWSRRWCAARSAVGEEVVWCLDDRANCLVLYHSATYQLCPLCFGTPAP